MKGGQCLPSTLSVPLSIFGNVSQKMEPDMIGKDVQIKSALLFCKPLVQQPFTNANNLYHNDESHDNAWSVGWES